MQYDLSILFFLKKGQVDKKGLIPIYPLNPQEENLVFKNSLF